MICGKSVAVAAYCIGYENDLQKEKTKVKRELKGKIEKLVVYKTKREYQGTFIDEEFVEELIHYINSVIIQMEMMPKNSAILSLLQLFNLEELISITIQNTRRKGYKQKYMAMRDLERRYVAVLNDKRGDITNRDVMSTTVIRKNNLEEEDR